MTESGEISGVTQILEGYVVHVATVKIKTISVGLTSLAMVMLLISLPISGIAASNNDQASQQDSLVYTVKSGDTLIKICSRHRSVTNHYSLNDLLADIRSTNQLKSNLLHIGQKVIIPIIAEEDPIEVALPVVDGAEMRGIYLTGPACGSSSVFRRVDQFIAVGGNAVVFDAKDIDGGVSFRSQQELASWGKGRRSPVISSLPEMIRRFDKRDLYVVARLALFLDGELGAQRPDLALKSPNGDPWTERGCTWMDPANPDVRAYNLTLAMELAASGVDEIQFDYVRFPTNGYRDGDDKTTAEIAQQRRDVITDFLAVARDSLSGFDVRISADLYGIMAWGRMDDLALTGQHVPSIAAHVDIICPMIYPSHFGPGFEGRKSPGDDPEYFISEGTRRFVALADGQAEIRPWLQAFPFRVSNYNPDYITTQVMASRGSGGSGWCLWNPSCRYGTALAAMPDFCDPLFIDDDSENPVMVADHGPLSKLDKGNSGHSGESQTGIAAPLLGTMARPMKKPVR